jgi:exportin-2 (importin alpha re-exporter)
MAPFLQVATQHLVGILAEISKNPSNPRFNHYLFESLAALIRYSSLASLSSFVGPTSPENLALLEATVVPQLLAILSQGVEGTCPQSH